jgi:hypothetical protein
VLHDDAIEYTLTRFEEELRKHVRSISGQMSSLERKKAKLTKEAANLAKAIASGLDSSTVRTELLAKEAEIKTIEAQVLSANADSVKMKIQDVRKFVESSLKDIRAPFNSNTTVGVKAAISRHMPVIRMRGVVKPDGRKVYEVVSEWELLGGTVTSSAHLDGAEGAVRSMLPNLPEAVIPFNGVFRRAA